MKIRCEREPLLAAFQTAASVVPTRSPKPILQNVKLVAREHSTVLIATDLEVGIRIEATGIEVEAPGDAVLPTTRVGSILRESSDSHLRIHADGQGCQISGDRSKFKLTAFNPDEFPEVASFKTEDYCAIQAELFRELIRRTIFATETESSRYALGGVLLELEPDRITAVGTDGRRLAKMDGGMRIVGDPLKKDLMTIVPSRSLHLMERAFSGVEGEIQLSAGSNDILVRSDRATVFSRLVEGRFPRWRDVLPQRTEAVRLELPVGSLYSAVRQAAVVATEESRGVDFTFGNGSLVLSASTAELGESQIEFPIAYDGPEIRVSLDHRFISDFLRVLELDRTFTMEVLDAESAALLTTDDGFAYVVMPMAKQH